MLRAKLSSTATTVERLRPSALEVKLRRARRVRRCSIAVSLGSRASGRTSAMRSRIRRSAWARVRPSRVPFARFAPIARLTRRPPAHHCPYQTSRPWRSVVFVNREPVPYERRLAFGVLMEAASLGRTGTNASRPATVCPDRITLDRAGDAVDGALHSRAPPPLQRVGVEAHVAPQSHVGDAISPCLGEHPSRRAPPATPRLAWRPEAGRSRHRLRRRRLAAHAARELARATPKPSAPKQPTLPAPRYAILVAHRPSPIAVATRSERRNVQLVDEASDSTHSITIQPEPLRPYPAVDTTPPIPRNTGPTWRTTADARLTGCSLRAPRSRPATRSPGVVTTRTQRHDPHGGGVWSPPLPGFQPLPTAAIGSAELAPRWNRPWNGLCSTVEPSVEPFVSGW